MIEKLISSKARVEILKLLLFNTEKSYYQSQIAKLTNQPIRAVQREIERLLSVNLITEHSEGNRVYYRINPECSILEDLKSIFLKTTGIAEELITHLQAGKKDIVIAFIFGSYARGQEDSMSDIDLIVIGDISSRKLSNILAKPKNLLGREINYAVFSESEFQQKVRKKDHFIKSVLHDQKIFLVGTNDDLKKIIRSR
jgi:predicted nucleotidyltransferase/predicted transcriptional regulator